MRKLLIAFITAGAGLSFSLPALADQASAENALKEAEAATHKAQSIHFLWTSTQKLMKEAQAAMKKNEYDQAEKMAKEAKIQADLSLEQAKEKPLHLLK